MNVKGTPVERGIGAGTKAMTRARRRLAGIALTSLLALAVTAPAASADRAFSTRFATTLHGGLTTAGNTLLTCNPATAGCTTALAGGGTQTNGDFTMRRVDVDGVTSTFDSSTATVSMPAGAEVVWAGLYWGASTGAGTNGSAAPNASLRNRVRLTPPDATARTVTADRVDADADDTRRYQGFADITTVVRSAGEGQYTVADVQAATGLDRYAGWGIVVAYRLASGPGRRIVVSDGYQPLMRGRRLTTDIALGGFVTPAAGTVAGRLVMLGWEGDRTITPDSASLEGQPLTDAANPVDDNFNSTISRDGAAVTIGRSPDPVTTLGVDLDDMNVTGFLPNNATSATVRLTTGYERFLPGVVALAIADSPPRNTAVPVISGTPATGETLTATTGTWTGSGPIDHTFQWQRCDAAGANCVDIPGATSATYTLTADDAGSTVRVVVVGTNGIGPGDPAASAPTAAVTSISIAAGNPAPAPPSDSTTTGSGAPTTGTTTSSGSSTTNPADLSTLPGSAIAAARCTTLVGGGGFQRANLAVSGPTRLRVRADGALVPSSPAVITVIADRPAGLRSVRYQLDGRTVRGRRSGDHRLLLGPSQLTLGSHRLTARLRLGGGTTRTLGRTLRIGVCRSRFTARQYRTTAGTGVRLRVDTAAPASRVTFRVPTAIARRLSRGTPAGRIRLVTPTLRRQYRFSPATSRRPSRLVARNGSPGVRIDGHTITVTGLPASTGIVELTVYQPRAPQGSALLARGRKVTARATVRSTRTLRLRATMRGTGGSTR